MRGELLLWTVYSNPLDHPGKFVARQFSGGKPTELCCVDDSCDVVMQWIRQQYTKSGNAGEPFKLMRDPLDHPTVLFSMI